MQDTLSAWRAMEALVPTTVSSLGLSNVDAESLRQIYIHAVVKPSTIQNRFTQDTAPRPEADLPPGLPYPAVSYDKDVRDVCEELGVTYVPWGLLWGNPAIMGEDPEQALDKLAAAVGVSKQVAWYGCIRSLGGCGVAILCGTTKEAKMKEVVTGLARLGRYIKESEEQQKMWRECVDYIKSRVN